MVSLDASFDLVYFHIQSSGRVLETSKLKPLNSRASRKAKHSLDATMFEIINLTRPLTSRPPTTSSTEMTGQI